MSTLVSSSRTDERGPRLVAPDSPSTPLATSGSSPGCPAGFGVFELAFEYGPRASGRPWKMQLPRRCPGHLVWDHFCPMRVEPLAVIEPSAWSLKKSWDSPTPSNG